MARVIENWVKFQKETYDKPEVRKIAKILGTHEVHAAAYCLAFWCYADSHMREGFVPLTDCDDVDGFAHCPGFGKALEAVGWVRFADGGVYVSNPDVHLSGGAKGRAEATARKHNSRANARLDDPEYPEGRAVTDSCDTLSQKSVTRVEESREEKSNATPNGVASPKTGKPSVGASAAIDPEVPELAFECDGSPNRWCATESMLAEWQGLYPKLDIRQEIRDAIGWTRAAPERRKTARGMKKFLVGWFIRSNDRGQGRGQQKQFGYGRQTRGDRERFDPGVICPEDPEYAEARF